MADVNLNRLAESLKLTEDAARFIFEDRSILKKVRRIRNDLKKIKIASDIRDLIRYRNSITDPGRPGNFDRPSLGDTEEMVVANINRAKESCRTLEELFKIENHVLSRFFKAVRFQLYDIEKDFFIHIKKRFDPSIYAVMDDKYIKITRLKETTRILVRYGVTMIQLRIKTWSDRRFINCARVLRNSLIDTPISLIINNRPDIALLSRANGVHLGQDDLPIKTTRKLLGKSYIIGASVHTPIQAIDAENQGADYLGIGALYPSRTKPESPVCGLSMIKTICRIVKIPVIGIGGDTSSNQRQVINCGAAGVAVGEYIFTG